MSRVAANQRQKAVELAESEDMIHGGFMFRMVDLGSERDGVLHLEGEEIHAPWLVPEVGELTGVAVGLATIGSRPEDRTRRLFAEKKASVALGLDSLGTAMLMATARGMEARLWGVARRAGLTVAGELRPGDPGLAIGVHANLLRLLEPERMGVRLSTGGVLTPLKTTTVMYGVGIGLPPANWSSCDHCSSRPTCSFHQTQVGL